MTDNDRWELYNSSEFHQIVSIKLLDWAGYWAKEGLDEITDALQKEQTHRAINMVINDLSYVTNIVVSLAISSDNIKNVSREDLTPEIVNTAIVYIMANELLWVTDVREASEPAVPVSE